MVSAILYAILGIGSVFLILLVLIQKGKGGGLAGALGGMGGSSAFGTRAGDVFTKITIIAAGIWILAAMILARINVASDQKYVNKGKQTQTPAELTAPPVEEGPTSSKDDDGKAKDDDGEF